MNAYELCGDETPAFVTYDGEHVQQASEVSFQVGKGLILRIERRPIEQEVLEAALHSELRLLRFGWKQATAAEKQLSTLRINAIHDLARKLGVTIHKDHGVPV